MWYINLHSICFSVILFQVYKSSSKRKAHILKNHPGAELPPNAKQIKESVEVIHSFYICWWFDGVGDTFIHSTFFDGLTGWVRWLGTMLVSFSSRSVRLFSFFSFLFSSHSCYSYYLLILLILILFSFSSNSLLILILFSFSSYSLLILFSFLFSSLSLLILF